MKTKAMVITGNGTNCEMEAAHACKLGGFDEARIAHISDLLAGDVRLDDIPFSQPDRRFSGWRRPGKRQGPG